MSDSKISYAPFAAFVLGLTSAAAPAQEQWSPDPNANNPVAVVADVQSFPIVVGNFYTTYAWRSARFDVGTGTIVYDIDAQQFDTEGVPQWGPTGVRIVSGSVSGLGSPAARPFAMIEDPDGVILAWHDTRNAPDAGDIYAQKLNSAGIPQWVVGGIPVSTAFGLQVSPVLVTDGSGGAIVAWQDQRNGPANSDIFAQRVNASGLPQWFATGVLVCIAPGNQLQPASAANITDGRVVITWTDSRGGDQDIYAQQLSFAGGPQWTLDGIPVSAAPGNQRRVVIDNIGNGWVMAWEDERNGGDEDVYAQKLERFSGAALWTANGVQVASTPNASAPILLGESFFPEAFIAWQDERNGSGNADIFAQVLDSAGVPQWGVNGVTVCGATGNQVSPVAVRYYSGPLFIVAWEDSRNGAADIFAQGIDSAGSVVWTPDGVPISTAPDRQARISMRVAQSALIPGALLVWEDDRNAGTATDIYAAKVGLNGVLPVSLSTFRVE
jgi:hypothetical protein